jgi:transglutaminase-like putative cysteine protease
MVSPLEDHAGQRRISERLRVAPEIEAVSGLDRFGNIVVTLCADRVDEKLEIEFHTTIERSSGFEIRRVDPRWLSDPAFREPTPLTRPDGAIRAAAERLRQESRDDVELAAAINAFVFGHMTYRKDATSVATTAAEAFALRAGVCQDYAHVMLSIARACGLSARYVSGHMIGEAATHAWTEIVLPSEDRGAAVAWPFDPTNNRPESLDYVVVAIGRDYGDVAPTSGTFEAPYNGVLTVENHVVAKKSGG